MATPNVRSSQPEVCRSEKRSFAAERIIAVQRITGSHRERSFSTGGASYNARPPDMEPRPIHLTLHQPNLAPAKLHVDGPTITLGRATDCSVPIKDRYLSR